MIARIAKLLGLDAIVVYVLVALLGLGSIWTYGVVQYRAGKDEGALVEQAKWAAKMADLRAENERKRQNAQAEIDRIEMENLGLIQDANKADAGLEKARRESATRDKICLPRAVGQALNKVGRSR